MGMSIARFEKEINYLLKILEERKGCRLKISGEKRNYLSASRLEWELRKLECVVSYNSSLCSFKGKERNSRGSTVVL